VVIDAGTAMTADFVDQWGTFQGGAIAPGLSAMLAAMHSSAEGLPAVEVPRAAAEVPSGPWATTTRDAMVLGALLAVRGMAHRAIERYALAHGSYPRVIATGGDAPLLFGEDELIEHIVPDLVLIGMAAAWWSEFGG
jgi:type III pantothenate kinase